jgi:hypothetical protein
MRIYRSSLPYMHIFPSVYAHFGFRICTFFPFCKCTYTEAKMRIYRSQNAHIQKLSSIYVHLRKPKCAYTEAEVHIYKIPLPYMRIYGSQNVHIRKRASIYAHFVFCIPYMHILSYVYVHFVFPKCAYTEALFCICTFFLPYMRIYGSSIYRSSIYERELPYMRILTSVNTHIRKTKCAYTEERFCIWTF